MATLTVTTCYHCGNDCPVETLVFDDKHFCCDGCKTVYSILNQHQLCQYYAIEQADAIRPGNSPGTNPTTSGKTRLEFLDHPDIVAQLLEFSSDSVAKVTFYIPTIHCSSCLWLLEHLYRINPAIQQSRVDFLKKQVHLTYNPTQITLRQVVELLASIGYEPLISPNDTPSEQPNVANRGFLYRLGVAGFCAGNIMLFSFPEYLGLDDPSFKHLFGILNVVLAIPVAFYSASGYFVSVWKSLKKGVINIDLPILLGILVAFFRGTYEVFALDGAGYFDSLTGLIFFLLCGKWFQQRTHEFLSFERDYKSYFPMAVTVVGRGRGAEGNSNATSNPAPDAPSILPIEQLRKGDRIRVRNQELIPADGLLYKGQALIDYSFVTGESEPEPREPGSLIYAGGKQVGEAIELEVIRDVTQSYLTQLWNNDVFRKNKPSRITTFADKVGTYFTLSVITLATLAGTYWYLQHDPARAVNVFTAVLIIACPCALSLSYPFALGNGLRLLSKRHLYLKNAEVIEQMAACDAIVFDKTGTLTTAQTNVTESFAQPLSLTDYRLIAALVQHSSHPLSRKLANYLGKNSVNVAVTDFAELAGKGIQGIVDGQFVTLGSHAFVARATYLPDATLADESVVHVRINNQYRGYFGFPNQYRTGLDTVLSDLSHDYKLYLLSGDNDRSQDELRRWFPTDGQMHFNCRPDEKLAFINHLQAQGKRVMMVGDGLNDAGALKQADVGIAITEDTIQFTPSSDAILKASTLSQLSSVLRYTRFSMRLIRFSFIISLIYNFIGLSFALVGNLSPIVAAILMPISSATMLAIATLGMRWKKM
ncbi:heavy metal translocating P-type ATPase metal-binding domain-containing protein [Spirosoma daeguense]